MIDSSLMESPGWMAAGWTMMHFLWVGTIVGIAGALVRWLLALNGPNVRYAVALVCLSALATAPVVIAVRVFEASVRADVSAPFVSWVEPLVTHNEPALTSTAPPRQTSPVVVDEKMLAAPAKVKLLDIVASWLPWFWLSGAPIVFVVATTGLIGAERLSRQSRLLEGGDLPAICERLARSLKIARHVAVKVSDRLNSPVLLGILRPVILLPPAAITGWSPDQIEMVLLHELAHVRRWDILVNLLQRMVESILFFHPAVWWVSRWIRLERELACDAVVVARTGRPNAYAEFLAGLGMPSAPAGAAAGAMAKNDTVVRIRRILNLEDRSMKLSHKVVGVCSILILAPVLIVAAYAAQTDRDDSEAPQTATVEQLQDDTETDQTLSRYRDEQSPTAPAATDDQLLVTAVHAGKTDVFLLNLGNGETKNLTNYENYAFGACWSPTGKQIAFCMLTDDDGRHIYVMDADGQNVRQLTTDGYNTGPVWSPDGKRIAFRKGFFVQHDVQSSGLDWEIFVMDVDGANKINLTNNPATRESDANWSPDGKTFVFSKGVYPQKYHVNVMNTDGSNVRKLIERRTCYTYPAWSPDGKMIAYAGYTNHNEDDRGLSGLEVFVSNVDGTNEQQLTRLGGMNTMATWSPDGRRIAFLHVVFPDARRLFLEGRNSEEAPEAKTTLWMMDADGSNQKTINSGDLKIFSGLGRCIAWKPR